MSNTDSKIKAISGLREKPTYEELLDYIQKDNEKIKLPDRRAKFLRNSCFITIRW